VATAERKNPYAAFNFKVDFNENPGGGAFTAKLPVLGFMEVSGLDEENHILEYREGTSQSGDNAGNFPTKFPGLEKYSNVTLRRGITGHMDIVTLYGFVRNVTGTPSSPSAKPVTMNVVITLQDEQHAGVMKWTLENAWVCKLTGPSLNAKSNEIAIESIELCCDRITRATV
jgi:phage tail-like protein